MPRRADQKQWIRRKAAVLWAKQGYHGTGVLELCDATGLGKGSLYYHIGSKEDLLFDISIASVEKLIADAEVALATESSATEKFRSMAEQLMRNISDDLPEWIVFFREYNTLTGVKRKEVRERRAHYEGLWRRVLEEGQATAEFRQTDPILVKGLLGMFNYAYLWIRHQGTLEPEEIADIFCDALLRGMNAAAPPAGVTQAPRVGTGD
jgi:AcrR family transcriptional regulator